MSRRVTGWLAALLAIGGLACDRGAPGAATRFSAAGEGSVRDAVTGLDWTARDHGGDLDWHAAGALCRDLALAGHGDWRLPEIGELERLYDESRSQPCGAFVCRVDPVIALSRPFFWSATARPGDRRFYIDLRFGSKLAPVLRPSLTRRVLCVRRAGGSA